MYAYMYIYIYIHTYIYIYIYAIARRPDAGLPRVGLALEEKCFGKEETNWFECVCVCVHIFIYIYRERERACIYL